MSNDTALVIGAGAFGTSIGSVLSHAFKRVILQVRSEDLYENLKKGENSLYLPGQKLSPNMVPALTDEEVMKQVKGSIKVVVMGIPTSAIKTYCEQNYGYLKGFLDQDIPIVSLAKGMDPESFELPDDLFFTKFQPYHDQFIFLSGPSFAKEIVEKQVTLVSIAGRSTRHLKAVSDMFSTPYFRVFMNYDVKGLLLGGALKNVLAIAGGVLEGLGFNHNTRAAMITRGIIEMLRFGKVFNARPETFYGLSGMGDLILTTTGGLSRNKSFGLEIAKKERTPLEIINSQRLTVEGFKTSKAVYHLAQKYEIRARIFEGVYDVLYKDKDPLAVITSLMDGNAQFEV
jgi:glycerol-3-phosphate dehydrogenase (NAD(P)+)